MCIGTIISKETGFRCDICDGYGKIRPVSPKVTSDEAPLVFFVESGKPRSAHLLLEDVFKELAGEIHICDPYYGMGSLLRLDLLKHCSLIKFLTKNPDSRERQRLPRALQEFKQEHGNIEFRRHTGGDLHDRFIIADSELIILGHGLKDVGNKDSFIIRIPAELATDLIETLRDSFDAKWQVANIIT
jgi:hypothetical protein